MNCEQAEEILAATALGMADEAETRALRTHLASGCIVCAGRLAEMEAVAAQLAESLPVEPLPPSALPRLMDRVQASSVSLPPARTDVTCEKPSPGRRRLAIRFAAIAGLASVMLLIFAAGALQGLVYRYRAVESEDRLAKLTTEQERFRAALDAFRTREARWIDLQSVEPGEDLAWGRILWDEHRGRWFLFASGLHRAAEGRTYRLWAVAADKHTVLLGSFDPDDHNLATFDAELPREGGDWTSAIVTEEPIDESAATVGESAAPTGPVLLAGTVR